MLDLKLKMNLVERLLLKSTIIENMPDRGSVAVTFIPLEAVLEKIAITQKEIKTYAIKDMIDGDKTTVKWNVKGNTYELSVSLTDLEVEAIRLIFKLSDSQNLFPAQLTQFYKRIMKDVAPDKE